MVAPGFYSPDFIIKDSGITKAIFKVPQGPYKDSQKPLPLPWDERYLALWFNFIDQLSKRYSNNPSFSYISITGPNSHNGEISLPRDKSDSDTWLSLTGICKTKSSAGFSFLISIFGLISLTGSLAEELSSSLF